MKLELELSFAVNGSVRQTIEILTDEKPEVFFKKVENNDYLTSISGKDVLDINNNFKIVGKVVDQETLDDTEYIDFEKEE